MGDTVAAGERFDDVPVRYQFFQSSSFFPMPVVLVSTRAPGGPTNLAPFSLCFPQPAVGEDAMALCCRTGSNTAQNLEASGLAALCFIPDAPHYIQNLEALGTPGTTEEKMARSVFRLGPTRRDGVAPDEAPEIVEDAVQVYECRLDAEHTRTTSQGDTCYVLRIEKILLKSRWREALDAGVGFPRLPVDYGYRAPTSSWLSRPMPRFDVPRLRPRFQLDVPLSADGVVDRFRRALKAPGCPVEGAAAMKHVTLHIPKAQRTFWSPYVDMMLSDTDEGTRIHGRIGPHPDVWTLFLGLHAVVAFAGLGGLMFGISQWVAGGSAAAMWALPGALGLHAFIAGAGFIGQGLGGDQIHRLRAFVEDTLAT